jgi:hypothetical protein
MSAQWVQLNNEWEKQAQGNEASYVGANVWWWLFVKDDDMTLCRKRTLGMGPGVSRRRVASISQSPSDSSTAAGMIRNEPSTHSHSTVK